MRIGSDKLLLFVFTLSQIEGCWQGELGKTQGTLWNCGNGVGAGPPGFVEDHEINVSSFSFQSVRDYGLLK